MIRLCDISKAYSQSKEGVPVAAVQQLNLEIARGDFLVITGRSGSGKTTLLNLAAGLTRPTTGRIFYGEQDLWQISDDRRSELRNRMVGFIFQFPSLLPSLTALENVVLPSLFSVNLRENGAPPDATGRARELLATVGLEGRLNAYPRQLSAGQQQRVVVARSLINQPEILMADEPTSNLDERTEQEIMDLFGRIHAELGLTVLLVTHTRELISYGNRAISMAGGEILPA